MKINKLKFLPLAFWLFLAMFSVINAENPVPSSTGEMPYTCNLDAPTNLHSIQVGTTFIEIGWNQSGPAPTSYNVKVVKVSNGTVVYNMNFLNDGSHKFLLNGLPTGETLDITLTPKCANFENGPPVTYQESTIILELTIVSLFPSGNQVDCEVASAIENTGVWPPETYCEIPLGNFSHFKIVSEKDENFSKEFVVYNTAARSIKAQSNNSNYQFCCEDNSSEQSQCSGSFVTIKSSGSAVAKFEISYNENAVNFIRIFCTSLDSRFKIVRLGTGFASAPDDRDATLIPATPATLSASPNPFTNTLEVKIPYATEENDVNISLYDLQGRLVLSEKTTGGTQIRSLSTAELLPGFYLLRVDAGDRSETIKVVKTQ